mgnify:FL=1
MQKQVRGILALAALVSCIGTALAATSIQLPAKKPENPARQIQMRDPINDILASDHVLRPRRKPQAGMPPAGNAVAAAAAASAVPAQRASIFSRVFGHIAAGKRLNDHDAARYAHIFAFQDTGDFVRADAEIAKLDDDRLLGHVFYQRYMHPRYTARYDELAEWMRRYGDHPGAQRIHDLAKRRQPSGAAAPSASPT